jgi:putative sterol carrier protein
MPEALTVFSPAWIAAYKNEVSSSPSYRKAAAAWEGDMTLVIQKDGDSAPPEDLHIYMDLWHGDCRDIRLVPAEEGQKAKFVISGGYQRWKQVVRGELEPIKGMMQGKLKLRGNLAYIVRFVAAAKELVSCTSKVPSVFPDEKAG